MTTQPYRDPPEPCPDCVVREEAAEKMLPFAPNDERSCPECGSTELLWWGSVCTGGNTGCDKDQIHGWWLWKKTIKGPRLFECKLEDAPKHFHFRCPKCKTNFEMLTKTESR